MTLPTSPISRSVAASFAALITLVALAVAGPATALAKSHSCAAHAHTIAARSGGRVWHAGSSLFGCTTAFGGSFGHAPHSRKLGPWAPGTKITFDGVVALWSVPKSSGDRIWAANVDSGTRWLTGTRIVPGAAGEHFSDGRVQSLMLANESAAWVTKGSQVVLALHNPNGDPTPFGTLPAPLSADKQLLLVGSFPTVAPAALAATAKLEINGGDGDECGGSETFKLTVQPDPAGPRIGARWDGDWAIDHCG